MLASSRRIPVAEPLERASIRRLSVARLAANRPAREALALSIPMSRVRREGYTVFEGNVYDLKRFVKKHPGGEFLKAIVGADGTLALSNAHGKAPKIRSLFKRFYVGPFAEETRAPLERDVLALRAQLTSEGLFTYPRRRLIGDGLRWLAMYGLGALAFHWSHVAAFLLVLAGTVDVVWWIHDAGHDAVFADETKARRVIDRLGCVFLGMPQQGYHYAVHRMHHGFTNVVGIDGALDTGPVAWTEEAAAQQPTMFRRARVAWWFLGIVPLAGPALLYSAVAYSVAKKQRALVWALGVRWALVIVVSLYLRAPEMIFVPWIAGSILAFMAGLNHFHLPITAAADPEYARSVFVRTQNIRAGLFWHWLSGGLDMHIEHHLFPTMASYRYRAIAPRVQELAQKHRVPYRTTTRWGAVQNLVRALRGPLQTMRTPSEATS